MIILNFFLVVYYYYISSFYFLKMGFCIKRLRIFTDFSLFLDLNNNIFSFLLKDFHIVDSGVGGIIQKIFFFNIFPLHWISLFIIFLIIIRFLKNYIYNSLNLLNEIIFFGIIYNNINKYFFLKGSDYNFLYQLWYKFAKNQKNTYLSLRFRLVYLTKKFVGQTFFNNNIFKDEVQEYFVLRRKSFFDSHFRPVKIRKFVPLVSFRRKFYSKQRMNYSFKGLLFFYLKDYEDRINQKEQQQKTLRIYEGIFGTYIYQELIKKDDQKQAKFVKMKLNRKD
jgi:hypothetical protein